MRLGGRALDMTLPTDTPATIDVRNLSFDRNSGRFEALVVAPAQGPTATSLRVAGRATPKVDVPVLRRGLARGDVIGIDDIAWTSIAANRLYSGAIQSPRELVGMTARRNLRAHQPIRGNDIEKPVVIERGETVTLVLLHQGMQLTAQARALEDGAAGENIRLVNTTSSRTLTGRVRPNGAVVVSLPGADPAQM
jgi:flagella basal body P-ring formation protein FlgA